MSNFSVWAGSKNKQPLTKVHERPKRSLYDRLRLHANGKRAAVRSAHESSTELHFLATDDESSEEEEVVTFQLSEVNRFRTEKRGQATVDRGSAATDFVELEIEDGDTLHNLSLRYGCKVSEMKRINNLINDQEFYGRRKIKVPVKEHGLVREQLERANDLKHQMKDRRIAAASSSSLLDVEGNRNDGESSTKLISIRQSQDARNFLEQMDADLERIRQSTKTRKDTLEEVTFSLTCKRFHPFVEPRPSWHFPKLKLLIAVIVLALVVFPLIFILLMVHRKS